MNIKLIIPIGIITVGMLFLTKKEAIAFPPNQVISLDRVKGIVNQWQVLYFNNIPQSLVLGQIKQESNFIINAERYEPHLNDSSIGLMQILLSTAKGIGFTGTKKDLFKPEVNIFYGMKYLNKLYKQCKGNWQCTIMSYNEGFRNFSRGKRVYNYYNRVKANWGYFHKLIGK